MNDKELESLKPGNIVTPICSCENLTERCLYGVRDICEENGKKYVVLFDDRQQLSRIPYEYLQVHKLTHINCSSHTPDRESH